MTRDSSDPDGGPTRETLLEEIKRVTTRAGHVPQPSEIPEHGRYAADIYLAEFGSWQAALEAADVTPGTEVLFSELRRLQRELGRTPTVSDFEDESHLTTDDYSRHFDSWKETLAAADIFPTTAEIVEATRQLERELEHAPSATEFKAQTRYRQRDYLHHFDSWNEVLVAAGITPDADELVAILQTLTHELGHAPTMGEFHEKTGLSRTYHQAFFDSWDDALEAAGVFPTCDEILKKIERVTHELDHPPTLTEFNDRSPFRRQAYLHYFDSWADALEAADVLPSEAEILETIRGLQVEYGVVPTEREARRRLYLEETAYKRHFESWEEAIEAAGVRPTRRDILQAIRRTNREYGFEVLTTRGADSSTFVRPFFKHCFDRWEDALQAAGVAPERDDLLAELHRVIQAEQRIPSVTEVLTEAPYRRRDYQHHFESVEQAIATAVEQSDSTTELVKQEIAEEKLDRLREIASDLGHPPAESYVTAHTDLEFDGITDQFAAWGNVVEAAGLASDEVDRAKDLAHEIEILAEKLEHRPNKREIRQYVTDHAPYSWDYGLVRRALDIAEVPDERDLTPTRALTRQRHEREGDDIPSHTDLLVELTVIRQRSGDKTLEEAFEERGVIDRRHYEIQFGSFTAAVDHLESLDTRSFSQRREQSRSTPAPLLTESVEELADILERRPLLEEILFFGDANVADFLEGFDSWTDVAPVVSPIETWTNDQLLDEIGTVGRKVGAPPTLTEMTDLGSFPTQCYLRRFGSWPNALALVGVEIEQIPDEYLGFERTARLWEITDYLVHEEFGHKDALLDELYRLAFEFQREPTADDVRMYSPYPLQKFERAFGTFEAATETVDVPFRPSGAARGAPTQADLQAELRTVRTSTIEWVLPQHICVHTEYGPGTFLGVFGSLEDAFREAGLPTSHLSGATATYSDIWHSEHQLKTGLLRTIANLTTKTGDPPTVDRVTSIDGYSQNIIYQFFETWDEALKAAGVKPGIAGEAISAGDLDGEATENPDFVDDLLSDIDEMMEGDN